MAVIVSRSRPSFQSILVAAGLHRAAFFDHGVVKIVADPATGVIVDVNKAACDFYGYTREEMIGASVDLFALLSRDEILAAMTQARNGARNRFTTLHRLASGEVREMELHPHPVRVRGREYLVADMFDVTDRRSIERELAETRQRLDVALTAGEVGIWELDPTTGRVWSTRLHDKIFGYDPLVGDWSYDRFVEHVVPEDRDLVPQLCEARSKTTDYDIRIRRSDGTIRWIEVSAAPRSHDDDGGSLTVVGTVRDVTERKKSEERLQAAKVAAEEATWLKDRFLSLVAHDLRNPISSQLNLLRLLSDDRRDETTRGEILAKAISSGERTLMIMEDLLNISRLKVGALTVMMRPVPIRTTGEEALSSVRDTALGKGIRLVNHLPHTASVVGDKTMLMMVLQNLLVNAIKFGRRGSRVVLSMAPGRPGVLSVCDTGRGMPDETVEKLFIYGGVVSGRGTDGERGTGLGLPLSADLMRIMGGELRVVSEEGMGTLYYLALPLSFASRA